MKTIVTVTGIRPDFIRMSEIFKKLDENFNHILIHTGQHYDKLLSDVFFDELEIRQPNYNLEIGGPGKEHFHQLAELDVKLIELLRSENINPDLIMFLGDSNSVGSAFSLKKEGYKIGHIEAGMRSYDERMLEEVNRKVCDHCSDFLFVYHDDYKDQVLDEGISEDKIFVVGNTIVEVCEKIGDTLFKYDKREDQILLDIHRPENFKYKDRLQNILNIANECGKYWGIPVKMLKFKRTMQYIEDFKIDTGNIELIELMSYKKFIEEQYHSTFIISDSGTAQEEAALVETPVIVPRDFTERKQSVDNFCSIMIDVNGDIDIQRMKLDIDNFVIDEFLLDYDVEWLGDGKTSDKIIEILKMEL